VSAIHSEPHCRSQSSAVGRRARRSARAPAWGGGRCLLSAAQLSVAQARRSFAGAQASVCQRALAWPFGCACRALPVSRAAIVIDGSLQCAQWEGCDAPARQSASWAQRIESSASRPSRSTGPNGDWYPLGTPSPTTTPSVPAKTSGSEPSRSSGHARSAWWRERRHQSMETRSTTRRMGPRANHHGHRVIQKDMAPWY
jgi:hypothetical protein